MIRHRAGFTAVELLITVSILGIIAGIGIPSYANTQQRLRVKHAADELADVFRQAQTKAMAGVDGLDVHVAISGSTVTISNAVRTLKQWSAPSGITLSNTSLTFTRKTGRASSMSSINLTGSGQVSTVAISTSGIIVAN